MALTPAYTTQGCRLYFVNTTVSPATITYVDALNGFSGLSGDAKDIDTTNQDSGAYEERVKGLIAPGAPTGKIIFNAASVGWQTLKKLKEAQTKMISQFFYALGDAANTAVPTLASGILTPPVLTSQWARSGFLFSAYVKGLDITANTNDVITSTFKATTTGPIQQVLKGEANTMFH